MSTVFDVYNLPCADCSNEPIGRIPLARILDRLDCDYARNDLSSAKKHLDYWIRECQTLNDRRSELSLWNEMIGLCRRLNDFELAIQALERAADLIEALHLAGSVSGATIFLNMATTYKHFGKSDIALKLYDRVEAVYAELLSEESYEYAALYNNKATALMGVGRYEEAMRLLLRALDILELCPSERIDCAISYGNLAQLTYESKTDFAKADKYLDLAWETVCEPDLLHDGRYAFVCAKLSEVFALLGKEEAALALAEVAREIYEGT